MAEVEFEKGTDAAAYLADLRNYRSVVRALVEAAVADPAHAAALRTAVGSHPQPVRATAMTEDWCGDSACNLPVLTRLFAEAGIPFVVFRGSEHPKLQAHYHAAGVDHIPVVSLWDGNGREIARWIEQPAAVAPKKDAWKAARPEFMVLYAKRDSEKEAAKQFAVLYRQLLEEMAGWYTGGLWRETTREVVDSLRTPPSA